MSRAPHAAEQALIRELMSETERLRGLRFRAPVEVRIQDSVAMRLYVKSALDDAELQRARRRYVALGLLDPDLDVRELIESLMEEELVGYYDPEHKRLAIRDDVASSLSHVGGPEQELEWRATVVHELVHALQDQHLGLSEAMKRERTTDQENAFGAVVEGDATLAMLGYVAQRQGATLETLVLDTTGLAQSLRSTASQVGGRLARAPAIVREPLLFRYREGAVFAAYLFARGGWARVNDAHVKQPRSTLAVSYPARYHGAPDERDLELPELDTLSGGGCRVVDRDVLGSLEIGAALASPVLSAAEVAKTWRGDAYAVLACGASVASVWFLRFSSVSAARRVRSSFGRLALGAARFIAQHGSHLLVAQNLDTQLAHSLEPPFRAWASGAP